MLFSDRLYSEPILSPSGRYMAYFRLERERGGQDILVIRDLDAPESVGDPRNALPLGPLGGRDILWATEDRLLVSVDQYSERNPNVSVPSTFSIDRDLATQPRWLTGRGIASAAITAADVVDLLPDQPDHILLPMYNDRDYDLFRMNILTGERELVERGTPSTVGWRTADGVPVVRVDLFYDRVRYRTRSGEGGEWRYTAEIRRRELVDREHDFEWAGSTGEPGEIYVRARPEDADFIGIYRYDLETGDFLDPVAERDDYDIATALTNSHTGEYLGYAFVDDRLVYQIEDARFQAHYNALLGFFGPQMELRPRSISGTRMILRADGPGEVGSVYLYDTGQQSVDPVFSLWPETRTVGLRPMEPMRYTARDGLEIPAYVTWPAAGAGPETPLVVLPHGGPELRDQVAFDGLSQYLAQLGYAVFQPNFRGSAGYGRAFVEAGYHEFGRAMQTDIDDGVDVLIASGRVDPDRICIVGSSYGAYAAAMGMANGGNRYRCAVAASGVYDLPDVIEHAATRGDSVEEYWIEFIGDPERAADMERMLATSPRTLAERIDGPVLIYHGREDDVVPVRQARAFADALGDAGVPHVLLVEEETGHSWGHNEYTMRRIFRNVRDFLADGMDGRLDSYEPDTRPEPDED